jgi:transcriptional regulator with XRE-family HTH domain
MGDRAAAPQGEGVSRSAAAEAGSADRPPARDHDRDRRDRVEDRRPSPGLVVAKHLIPKLGMSLSEFARRVNVSKQYQWDLMTGRSPVGPRYRRDAGLALAELLGVPEVDTEAVRQVFFGDEQPVDPEPESALQRRLTEAVS